MLKSKFGCVRRAVSGSAMLAAVTAFAPGAFAQAAAPAPASPGAAGTDPEAPPEPPPAINLTGSPAPSTGPSIDLSTPAPAPPVAREFHQHEGFYVRVAAGLGTLLSADIDTPAGDLSSSGLTLNYDVLIGGSPAPGLALGGGLLGGLQMSGDWEADGGVSVDGDMATLIIGPFADGHPEPKGGLHFGGLAGLARVAFDVPGNADSALGFGGAFWAGHDVWVAPEWSLGGLLRLDALRASADDDVTVTEVGLTLMFSVLYN